MKTFLSLDIRITRYIAVSSAAILVLLFGFNAILSNNLQQESINKTALSISKTVSTVIKEDVWQLNIESIEDDLSLLLNLPYLKHAAVIFADGKRIELSSLDKTEKNTFSLNIYGKYSQSNEIIAIFTYQLSSADLAGDFWNNFFLSWSFQGLIVLTITLVIYLYIAKLVAKPLSNIADKLRSDDEILSRPFNLERRNFHDEIDQVVLGIDVLRKKVLERMEAEKEFSKKIAQEEALLRSVIESSEELIWVIDQNACVLLWNKPYEAYCKRNRLPELEIGLHFLNFCLPHEKRLWEDRIKRGLLGDAFTVLDMHKIREEFIYYEIKIRPIISNQTISGIACVSENITYRKKQEQMILNSLKEKEVLIRELYHRTKNNMNVIAALMKLHGQNFTDPKFQSFFVDMDRRIRSLSLVHEKLYKSNNLSQIDMAEYIRDLSLLLSDSLNTNKEHLEFEIKAHAIHLVVDSAMPIGLVINELILNAYEHGFKPRGGDGKIIINMSQTSDKFVMLEIIDDGVGIDEKLIQQKNFGVGLQTVVAIVEGQLRGSISLSRVAGGGTKVLITFSDTLYLNSI